MGNHCAQFGKLRVINAFLQRDITTFKLTEFFKHQRNGETSCVKSVIFSVGGKRNTTENRRIDQYDSVSGPDSSMAWFV